jgi:hypothetical protein
MSRRQIAKSFRLLKTELVSDVERIITREMGRLESVETAMPVGRSAPDNEEHAMDIESQQADTVTISTTTARNLYAVIEGCEDVIHLGRSGKMRSFEKRACELELLICGIDTEMLSQVNLTGEPAPIN